MPLYLYNGTGRFDLSPYGVANCPPAPRPAHRQILAGKLQGIQANKLISPNGIGKAKGGVQKKKHGKPQNARKDGDKFLKEMVSIPLTSSLLHANTHLRTKSWTLLPSNVQGLHLRRK